MKKGIFDGKLIYMIIAVLLAVALGLIALDQRAPSVEQIFNVPLEVRNLSSTLVAADLPDSVQVRAEGRKSLLEKISTRDFTAYIDLDDVEDGVHRADVKVILPSGIRLVDTNPAKVSVRVDTKGELQLPVSVEIDGRAASGYRTLDPVVTPDAVVITGPESLLNKVNSAVVNVSLDREKDSLVRTLPVKISSDGLEGRYQTSITPPTVKVFLPIVRDGERKEVPISVNIEGEPASGYVIDLIEVNPTSMDIFGSSDNLEKIDSIQTFPVDVSGKKEDFTTKVGLIVPGSVDTARPMGVDVFVKINTN